MKSASRILRLGLIIVLCCVFVSAGTAEPAVREYKLDCRNAEINPISNNLILMLNDGSYQVYSPDGTAALSDKYDIIYRADHSYSHGLHRVKKGNSEGIIDANGKELVPAQYGDAIILSDRWQVGISLKSASAENYDYHNSNKAYFLIDTADFYYNGVLTGSLDRMAYQEAEAFGDYLRVKDRENNYWFYNKNLQKADRLDIIKKKKEEQSARQEYYNDRNKTWHQGSGQLAYEEGCTLQPEEVSISLTYRDGAVLDLQGNIVCRPEGCEPAYFSYTKGSLILVRNSARKYGYIDRSGRQVVPCEYDDLNSDLESVEAIGYAYAVKDDKAGFVNIRTGEETGFEYSSKLCRQYAGFFTITDLDGELIIYSAAVGRLPEKFAEIDTPYPYTHASNPLAIVKDKDERYGVLNMRGEWVISPDAGFEGRDRLDASYDGTVIAAYRSLEREYVSIMVQPADPAGTTEIRVPSFDEVFVPAEQLPETTPVPAPAENGAPESWTCENGHEGNTGKFCSECGSPKPTPTPEPTATPAPENTEDTWTCENGHEGNKGKFCSECGAPKPAAAETSWTCSNGHEGNTGKFCSECGEPKPGKEQGTQQQVQAAPPVELNNPFPETMERFTVPFTGTYMDHKISLDGILSYATQEDPFYVAYESEGTASDKLAWTKYSGSNLSLYLLYQPKGSEVYAYAYSCDYPVSRRQEWAEGTLIPNLISATGAELWVESGENNDQYTDLLSKAQEETDYEATKKLLRNPDPDSSSKWFSHRLTIFREEIDSSTDRYWVVYHNTPD